MLDDLVEEKIELIKRKAKADINSVKYVAKLVEKGYFNKAFRNYSQREIYSELSEVLKEIHSFYFFGDENGFEMIRKSINAEKSIILGLEEIRGSDENMLDGYFDSGKSMYLTKKGKKILNGYRLVRGELSLDENNKRIHERVIELSRHLII